VKKSSIIITIIISVLFLGALTIFGISRNFDIFQHISSQPTPQGNDENPPNQEEQPPEQEPADEETPFPVTPAEIVWGNRNEKQVIFTFDAGSGTNSLQSILETLAKHNVKGTFFLTGKWAEQNPEAVKQISDANHEIFNHTYDHPHLIQLSASEIQNELQRTNEIIKNLTGVSTKPYFRPPFGERNSAVLDAAAQAGYQSVYWTIDVLDWKEDSGFTAEQAKERIFGNLSAGTIYLMHVGDNITGEILDEVFTQIENQGYKIVSLMQGV
jgi:peptidoglycan/xylan/chitin deacetylase (PgdA/CDA1 family)